MCCLHQYAVLKGEPGEMGEKGQRGQKGQMGDIGPQGEVGKWKNKTLDVAIIMLATCRTTGRDRRERRKR